MTKEERLELIKKIIKEKQDIRVCVEPTREDIEEELSFFYRQEKMNDEIMEFAIDRAFN